MFKWLAMVSGFIILVTANVVGIIYASEAEFKAGYWRNSLERLASACSKNEDDRRKIEDSFDCLAIAEAKYPGDKLVLGYLMHFRSEMESVDRFKKEYEEWWNNHIKEGKRLTNEEKYVSCKELEKYCYSNNPHLLLIRQLISSEENRETVDVLRSEEQTCKINQLCVQSFQSFRPEHQYFKENTPECMLEKVKKMLTVYKNFFPTEDEEEFNSKVGKWGPKAPCGILLAETVYFSLFKMVQDNKEQDLPAPFFAAWKQLEEWRKRNVSFPQDDKDSREEQHLENIRKGMKLKSVAKRNMWRAEQAEKLARPKVAMPVEDKGDESGDVPELRNWWSIVQDDKLEDAPELRNLDSILCEILDKEDEQN